MVLRNLNMSGGVHNGSQGILTHIRNRVLEIWLITGDNAGQKAFLPCIGLHTVPSDGYGHTIDGQVMDTVQLSTVRQVCSADPQQVWDGCRDGHSTVDGIRRLSNQSIMMLVA